MTDYRNNKGYKLNTYTDKGEEYITVDLSSDHKMGALNASHELSLTLKVTQDRHLALVEAWEMGPGGDWNYDASEKDLFETDHPWLMLDIEKQWRLTQPMWLSEKSFDDIAGHEDAKRAAMIAVAGNHVMYMIGRPGSGKTMLGTRMPSILPVPGNEEAKEIIRIHSEAGFSDVPSERPIRAPHHTISKAAFTGCKNKPGEIDLAYGGVLFLDEADAFGKGIIESAVERDRDYILVLSSNPCNCGFYPDKCKCSTRALKSFKEKQGDLISVSDIVLEVKTPSFEDIKAEKAGITSEEMKNRVALARNIQKKRYEGTSIRFNSEIGEADLNTDFCALDECKGCKGYEFAKNSGMEQKVKIIRIARTIADLSNSDTILPEHLDESCFLFQSFRLVDNP